MNVQPCAHPNAVPVETGGELVAALCPVCDVQLPAAWIGCDHPDTVEITELSDPHAMHLCQRCGGSFTGEPVEKVLVTDGQWVGKDPRGGFTLMDDDDLRSDYVEAL